MKLLQYILFEKYISILALGVASLENQHCASCIGTLSFHIARVATAAGGDRRRSRGGRSDARPNSRYEAAAAAAAVVKDQVQRHSDDVIVRHDSDVIVRPHYSDSRRHEHVYRCQTVSQLSLQQIHC